MSQFLFLTPSKLNWFPRKKIAYVHSKHIGFSRNDNYEFIFGSHAKRINFQSRRGYDFFDKFLALLVGKRFL